MGEPVPSTSSTTCDDSIVEYGFRENGPPHGLRRPAERPATIWEARMSVLITGGAGFIGAHVLPAYLEAGHQVVVVDDLSSGERQRIPKEVPFYRVSVCDQEGLVQGSQGAAPSRGFSISHSLLATSCWALERAWRGSKPVAETPLTNAAKGED